MIGNPQDVVAMIAAASLIFGSGGAAALRRGKPKENPDAAPSPTPEAPDSR